MNVPTPELAYIAQYGYVAIFIIIAASEVTSFIPIGMVLIAVGALARAHYLNLIIALLVAGVASTISDIIIFSLARKLGRKETYRRYVDNHPFVQKIESYVETHPRRAIFLSRMVGLVSTPVNAIAGLSQMSHADFIPFDFLGNALCALAYLGAGYYLGAAWEQDATITSIGIGIVLALAAVGYTVFYFLSRKKPSAS